MSEVTASSVNMTDEEFNGNISCCGFNNDSETVSGMNDSTSKSTMYLSSFGVLLAVPEWEAAMTACTLSLIIILTLVGNAMVILSVFTYRPLRTPPNIFIVSLAVADMTVALLVLPLNVAYSILGRWVLGKIICEFWLTSDVLCCTASILHLCAIAIDRYRAITDPVNYAHKRTLHRVLLTIAIVWIMSFLISSPPILGWNDWPDEFNDDTPCMLTRQRGYVIYSALGSFFIPLALMTGVYIRIYLATRRRLRQRAKASRLSAMARQKSTNKSSGRRGKNYTAEKDKSSISSIENNANDGSDDQCATKKYEEVQQSSSTDAEQADGGEANSGRPSKLLVGKVGEQESQQGASFKSKKSYLPSPLAIDDCDSSKQSPKPSSMIEDSEIEVVERSSNPKNNHVSRDGHSHRSSHHVKKSNRQPSQQVTQFVEEKQRISLSKERKAARTLGIIMGVFVVCWLPFFLMYVIIPFCSSCTEPSDKMINFITWLGYVNSSLNPIIYTIFNMDFRKAFKKILNIGK